MSALALAVMLAGGCSVTNIKDAQDRVDTTADAVTRHLEDGRKGTKARQASSVVVNPGMYIPAQRITLPDPNRPGVDAEKIDITINRAFYSIEEIAERITQLTGIPVTVENDALEQLADSADLLDEASGDASTATPGGSPFIPVGTSSAAGDPYGSGTSHRSSMKVVYQGPLSGLMNTVVARYGLYWGWNDTGDRLRIFRSDTRTFRLSALMGGSSMKAEVGGTDGSSSSSGMSMTSGTSFDNLSIWDGVQDSLSTMLSESGKLSVTPATGTVTVTDVPPVLEKVEAFIKGQNKALTQQVTMNVRVLSVTLSEDDNYGINWKAMFESVNDFSLSFNTGFSNADAASLVLSSNNTDSRWSGSEAIINALSERGRVSQVTSAVVTTLNNQLIPLRVGRNTGYVASASASVDEGVTTSSIETDTLSTGFTMNLLPHIIDNESLLVQFSADISSLLEMATFQSGDTTVQIPETENRNVHQRVRLNSMDTLVVAGFEQMDTSASKAGIGSPDNTWMGGSVNGNTSRTAIVILIQPIIAN
jgi:type IVB pilus formation R64 PilN family outer membrane protein